mgnify:CR=1 FL=1
MTRRGRRMMLVAVLLLGVGSAVALTLMALKENVSFFFSPTQVANGEAPRGYPFRVGGLVAEGSVQRASDSLNVRFVLTDGAHTVPVSYTGILPDLFREGQGIVARGRLQEDGLFVAEEVLAKHDENYMPPEVADALKKGAPLSNPHAGQ